MKAKVFKVIGWYRYDNGDEKDFIDELIIATDIGCAKEVFKEKYNRSFFSITVEKYEVNITPENVLNEFDKFENQLKELSNDRINMLIERIAQHGKANDWNLSQGKNLGKFGRMISQEMLIHLWSEITETNNLKSIQSFHSYIGTYLVEVANSTKDLLSKK